MNMFLFKTQNRKLTTGITRFVLSLVDILKITLTALVLICIPISKSFAQDIFSQISGPIETDRRILSLVYNENEVYELVTHFGYQSNIEFMPDERIMTISIGNQSAWQVSPVRNRLFVRPLLKNSSTNMTVITNRRAYQFDLKSIPRKNDDISYVIRFFDPEDQIARRKSVGVVAQPIASPAVPASNIPMPRPILQDNPNAMNEQSVRTSLNNPNMGSINSPQNTSQRIAPQNISPMSGGSFNNTNNMQLPSSPNANRQMNYKYTMSGRSPIAPKKVFDDGNRTYFKFASIIPEIYSVDQNGREFVLPYRKEGEYLVVNRVVSQFALRSGAQLICVFNEPMLSNFVSSKIIRQQEEARNQNFGFRR